MQTAKLQKDSQGWKVIIPAAVTMTVDGKSVEVAAGVETFNGQNSATQAAERLNAVNEAYEAAELAKTAKTGPQLEIMSLDGEPFDGVPTRKADANAIVYTTKPSPNNKLKEPKHTTEADIAAITGYVLLSRDKNGKIRQAWTNEGAQDFGRPLPITAAGLAAVKRLLTPTAQ